MAENKDKDERVVTREEQTQERQRVAAREASDESENPRDETIPGGKYRVGDQLVNADGEPVKDKPKAEHKE